MTHALWKLMVAIACYRLDEDGAVFVDVGAAMWHQLEPENPGHKSC